MQIRPDRRAWTARMCRYGRRSLRLLWNHHEAPVAAKVARNLLSEPEASSISRGKPAVRTSGGRQEDNVTSTHEAPVKATTTNENHDRAGKYLAFHLGSEEFAIRVLKVREIMGVLEITAVPQMPDYVKGVINLRGKVIPVVDLRRKFGLPGVAYDAKTCIIVVQVRGEAGAMMMGIIVDGVSEVVNLASSDIEDTPDFGGGGRLPYLLGMAKSKGKVRILLDIDQVLGTGEISGLESVLAH
jgi:purine-binding chemotaxis protein CheW